MGEARLGGTRPRRRVDPRVLTAVGLVVGLAVTAVILGTPYLLFGYYSPSLHLVLDSIDACVALLVAYLIFGRYLRSRLVQDLLLAHGLLLLAVAGLGLTPLLHLLDDNGAGRLEVWLPLLLRTTGALLIAASAVSGKTCVAGRWRVWGPVGPWVLVVAVAAGLWLLRDQLPVALEQSPPSSAQRPVVTGHPALLGLQALAAAAFFVATLAFTVKATRRRDELLLWLGPACGLAAFARVNYVLFPSLYSDWLYTGDLLRTGFYLLLLVGAAREISAYWTAQARVAVLDDRRRLARELHDGVVQELTYIRTETRALGVPEAATGQILAAADRGLDEARAAVDALGRSAEEPLAVLLLRAAEQVAERYGATLEADLDESVTADAEQRHGLVRIVREAVSNAARHGRAEVVRIQLLRDPTGRHLVVRDDGRGFDTAAPASTRGGYGLMSMRDRAAGLPGQFVVESTPGGGTTVGVTW